MSINLDACFKLSKVHWVLALHWSGPGPSRCAMGPAHELTSAFTAMLQLSYPLLKASGGGSVVYISSVGGGPTAMFSGQQLC